MSVPEVLCLGGATLDRKYRVLHTLQPGTSNPAVGELTFGGVARNVSEMLARLGVRVALATLVGDDESGRALVRQLATAGVDISPVTTQTAHRTAEYIAVLDGAGGLAFGLADMAIFDAFDVSKIDRLAANFASVSWVFADCNLSADVLSHLVQRARVSSFRLAVDPVSVVKAARLPADLTGIDLLVLNRDEAATILNRTCAPDEASKVIHMRGAASVIITDGANGLLATDRNGIVNVSAHSVSVKDVTGAGDALIAAVLAGLIAGATLGEAARMGAYAAALTVASSATVRDDLTFAMLWPKRQASG